jgi:hypothetical protein
LKRVSDDQVRVYVIWDPIFGGNFEGAAKELSYRFPDKRISYFKDPDSLAGKQWKQVLKLDNEIAWDVYFLYGADAQWGNEPPQPDFWMHQLFGVTKAPGFNEPVFEEKLKEMLNTVKEKGSTVDDTQTNSNKLKVEFLYFKSCPSHKQALENLKAALRETRTKAELILINVETPEKAEKVGFQGSPSIRINGKDLEGRDEGFSLSCRVYRIDGKTSTTPSKAAIIAKLESLMK